MHIQTLETRPPQPQTKTHKIEQNTYVWGTGSEGNSRMKG